MEDTITSDREVLLNYYKDLLSRNLIPPCKRQRLSSSDGTSLSDPVDHTNNGLLCIETRDTESLLDSPISSSSGGEQSESEVTLREFNLTKQHLSSSHKRIVRLTSPGTQENVPQDLSLPKSSSSTGFSSCQQGIVTSQSTNLDHLQDNEPQNLSLPKPMRKENAPQKSGPLLLPQNNLPSDMSVKSWKSVESSVKTYVGPEDLGGCVRDLSLLKAVLPARPYPFDTVMPKDLTIKNPRQPLENAAKTTQSKSLQPQTNGLPGKSANASNSLPVDSVLLVENQQQPLSLTVPASSVIDVDNISAATSPSKPTDEVLMVEVRESSGPEQGSYPCPHCDKQFAYMGNLKRHIKMHHGEYRPYKCNLCVKRFWGSDSLEQHCRRVHSKDKPYACAHCEKKYSVCYDLQKHVRSVHGKDIDWEVCVPTKEVHTPTEEDQGVNRKKVTGIKTVHLGQLQYKCKFCNRGFATYNGLGVHLKMHFRCKVCLKGFNTEESLKTHVEKAQHYQSLSSSGKGDKYAGETGVQTVVPNRGEGNQGINGVPAAESHEKQRTNPELNQHATATEDKIEQIIIEDGDIQCGAVERNCQQLSTAHKAEKKQIEWDQEYVL